MGNAHAASDSASPSNVPSSINLAPPPPPPTQQPPREQPPPAPALAPLQNGLNPGTYEDLHKNCKEVFPQVFEGGKLIISKGLSSHFQVSHTLSLATFQPSGYRFGCTYVGTKQISPQESFPIMIGDIDPSGNLNANIIHAFSDRLRAKCVAQIQNNKCVASQLTTDYKGKDFTASVTAGNFDPVSGSGLLVGQYLQRINSNLSLGAELLYQFGPQVPGEQISVLSLAGRWTGNDWQASANVSPLAGNLHACYVHKINDQMNVAAELETSLRLQESTATVGYQVEIPNAYTTFKAQLDTNWCVGAVMEKKLHPFPFTFVLSGYMNHGKGQFRLGVGLLVG